MSKCQIKCAECGEPAVERGAGDDDFWDIPFCATCGKGLTVEGLLIEITGRARSERVRELGRSGLIVLEYDGEASRDPDAVEAERLLRRINDLKRLSAAQGKVVSRQQYLDALANFPLASARFRRWFREDFHGRPLEVTDKHLVPLARAILEPQSDAEIETAMSADEKRQKRFYDWGSNYELRMQFEDPLILKGRLPTFVRDLIHESQDAFRWELPKAAIAACRMAIDGLIVEIAKAQFRKLSETTRRRIQGSQNRSYPTVTAFARERTDTLIDDLPESYLKQSEKQRLKALRDHCNAVIHGRRREGPQMVGPLDKSAWSVLRLTIHFISVLMERDSLTT